MMDVRGKRVLIVGLARSGRAAAHQLRRCGAVVTVTDSRPPAAFSEAIGELVAEQIGLELGLHRRETFLRQKLIVTSPGVPWDHPLLRAARERRIPTLPEVEVASWFLKGKLAAVTGTNGKTTTTTLLGRMLQASGLPTLVGGNIGVPLISLAQQAGPETIAVAEMSSFQLEAVQHLRPHVAVLLNLTPNHLDRHSSFETYVAAKAQIFRNQTAEDYAVLNADDPTVMGLAPAIASRKVYFSRLRELPAGVSLSEGQAVYRVGNLERVLFEPKDVLLKGAFNLENVFAASAAACVLGADFRAIRRAIREFQGVEHRLEFVREICEVAFYNDSKATSVDATAKALSAFDGGVYLIMGGKDKGAPYRPLAPLLAGRVREVLVIGEAAEKIAGELGDAVDIVRAGDIDTAVRRAFESAAPGDVVLLAPACSSFDQFQDFEHRGQAFKVMVARLAEEDAGAGKKPGLGLPVLEPAELKEPLAVGDAPVWSLVSPDQQEEPHPTASAPRANLESRTPDPAPRTHYPEFIMVYEVAAEEVERGWQIVEAEETEPYRLPLGPVEDPVDEPMPFEFRLATALASDRQETAAR
ncbi:MAG TPA: UDP-N-acetylmuramoyl-L-alanine--D-glutamate ligase [Terriglobia bacterium]|nr:UDP-N-acetylmuramoyl-L-alanine--D-glutamate ligase [Terriglobia bacterium]